MLPKVLVVDDEAPVRFTVSEVLTEAGCEVSEAADVGAALGLLSDVDLVVTDLSMPGRSGLDLLDAVQSHSPELPVILLTARGNERTAVSAMKRGAFDYLCKPFDNDELTLSVRRAAERVRLQRSARRRAVETHLPHPMIGESQAFLDLVNRATRVADREINVLLQGETGTGKEGIAALIHAYSKRHNRPLVRFNCAALTDGLAEAELFGYERGAFTGAARAHDGFFRRADRGTLVLDEVFDLPPSAQSSLLRALQEGEVQPLGARQVQRVDVRVIACTHVPLAEVVQAGRFRADLFYRLNVVELTVPPLRSRTPDIPRLARHFQLKYAERFGLSDIPLPEELVAAWCEYDWPGNVRQLENTVAELLALSHDGQLDTAAIQEARHPSGANAKRASVTPNASATDGQSLRERLAAFERQLIEDALGRSAGNQSQAARLLGTTRTTLIDKMKRLGIQRS